MLIVKLIFYALFYRQKEPVCQVSFVAMLVKVQYYI